MLQIDQKLTFNVFHILNKCRISKIEKISDGTDHPQKKRSFFFEGGSGTLDEKDFGYISGRLYHNSSIEFSTVGRGYILTVVTLSHRIIN